jgi:hypothetical protein
VARFFSPHVFFFPLGVVFSRECAAGNPGQYKDFNKTAADLLNKVFPKKTGANTWGVEIELRPTANNTFGGKITSVGGVSTGEVSTEFALREFGLTNKILFRTDRPTLEASWKVANKIPVDGLSATVHFDATDKSQTAGVSLAYEHRYATLNARVAVPISVQLLDFAKEISGQDTTAEVRSKRCAPPSLLTCYSF